MYSQQANTKSPKHMLPLEFQSKNVLHFKSSEQLQCQFFSTYNSEL